MTAGASNSAIELTWRELDLDLTDLSDLRATEVKCKQLVLTEQRS